jgi:ribosomal protein S13
VSLAALLLNPPACLASAKVLDLLLALPTVGRVKATKVLNSARVSPSKTFGGLSERQRTELAGRLEHRKSRASGRRIDDERCLAIEPEGPNRPR